MPNRLANDEDNPADVIGVVQSLAAPDFISGELSPKFTFGVLIGGKEHRVLSLDLERPGAEFVVPIVCAAFQTGVEIKVWFIKIGEPDRVDWVQVPKPPRCH